MVLRRALLGSGQGGRLQDRAGRPRERAGHQVPQGRRQRASSTSAGTAAPNCAPRRAARSGGRSNAPITHGLTISTASSSPPRTSPRCPISIASSTGCARSQSREWLGYVWVCLADEPPSFEATVMQEIVERLGDLDLIDHYAIADLSVGRRIVYDVKANWKLIIENFMECYHCATIHPELTEVLPEFADGYAAQFYVGHGAEFGEDVKGFTVDGSEGLDHIPGVDRGPGPPLLRDHRPPAGLRQPGARPRHRAPDVPDGRRPHHRRVRLAVPAGRGRVRPRREPVGRTVPPGQHPGLRGLPKGASPQ